MNPLRALLLATLLVAGAGHAEAHPTHLCTGTARVTRDGSVTVSARFDVLAFALNDTSARISNGSMDALLDGPPAVLAARLAEARDRFLRGTRVSTDAGEAELQLVHFPEVADVLASVKEAGMMGAARLPVVLEAGVSGKLPAGAHRISVRYPGVFDAVILTVDRPGEEPYVTPVEPGDWSEELPLDLDAGVAPPASDPGRFGKWGVAWRFLGVGFRHVVPEGLDHILFVLGLFFASTGWRPFLLQVTAFTVAHSISLGLSLYGVVHLDPRITEPLIALSIAYVAIENAATPRLTKWRPLVVFGFGLIHGLGFAEALRSMNLRRPDYLSALVGFNGGVELAQLTVIAGAFLLVGWFRHRAWYRSRLVVPASLLMAAVALFWAAQRIIHGPQP